FGGGADPLRASDFVLALGGGQDGVGARRGRRWQVWGQGDVQTFRGAPSDAIGYGGQLRTAYLGVDTWLTGRWMAGVAVARSAGDGDWRAGGARGALETTLTAVHPYVLWSDGTTSVWATAGGGWGEAENQRATGRRGVSGLGLRLGLVELRRRLGSAGGVQFGVRADAAWAELRTEAGEETIDSQMAAVRQVRVGAKVSRPVRLGGLTLAPFTEVHVRRDGGVGQTGEGVEVAGGARAMAGMVKVDAQGRLLVVHSAAAYRERGVGLTLGVGSQNEEGLSLSVSPRWGDSPTGGGALWQEQAYRQYVPAAVRDEWEVDARGGYGLRLPGGRLLIWFGTLKHSPYGRSFLIGAQIGAHD
ncbi:MAG: autotransporter outer membrane beta-barrel domain-containing protein, partial [Chloroflexi bacterium]|nr:autotransporter outer membrane beta-barrel domain-containing protein [Chloroflexota bacterium]